MLEELVIKYNKVAFLCNNKIECEKLVNIATTEMHFSKTIYTTNSRSERIVETKNYILNHYFKSDYLDHKYYCIIINAGYEYQFSTIDYREKDLYDDLNKFKIINFSILIRKDKLLKIKEDISHYSSIDECEETQSIIVQSRR
jgi:hypothetical protein